jgi:hypothetical protein
MLMPGCDRIRLVEAYRTRDRGPERSDITRAVDLLSPAFVRPGNGREALVIARVETETGPLAALLEVVVVPGSVDPWGQQANQWRPPDR